MVQFDPENSPRPRWSNNIKKQLRLESEKKLPESKTSCEKQRECPSYRPMRGERKLQKVDVPSAVVEDPKADAPVD